MYLTSKNEIAMRQKNEIRPCQECGQPIDPAHKCPRCIASGWCGKHNSRFLKTNAKFCDPSCRRKFGDKLRKKKLEEGRETK